jgi:hypothetical protein
MKVWHCLAAFAMCTSQTAIAGGPGKRPQVPIIIESDANLDPCGVGVVHGLKASGDGFLSVRSGPGTGYQEIDRAYNGQYVYWCAQKGTWVGIVYGDNSAGCNVMTAWAVTQPYTGPCRSGWVHERWVMPYAEQKSRTSVPDSTASQRKEMEPEPAEVAKELRSNATKLPRDNAASAVQDSPQQTSSSGPASIEAPASPTGQKSVPRQLAGTSEEESPEQETLFTSS